MHHLAQLQHPLAITMWDFSWLERRWSGAGYEDWAFILDELSERGYNAVRIDAFPHLIAADPHREWELLPVWNQHSWGSPALNRVRVQPFLNEFIEQCARRNILVALSSWFREDRTNTRSQIKTPADLGHVWRVTLDSIQAAGLLDHVLYVDLCNEFPLDQWAAFLPPNTLRASAEGERWMREAIAVVRQAYPHLDYCFSFNTEFETWQQQDVSFFDLLEPHIWMAQASAFYELIDYHYERFEPRGYENLALRGEALYRQKPAYWQAALQRRITCAAQWSRIAGKSLVTTECWGVVDYKDHPLLDWGWVKELCEFGLCQAIQTGRWSALATSNFCGPQFIGMWRDVHWHQRLTQLIRQSTIVCEEKDR